MFILFNKLQVLPYCESYMELELIKPDDLFFIATVERGSGSHSIQQYKTICVLYLTF